MGKSHKKNNENVLNLEAFLLSFLILKLTFVS